MPLIRKATADDIPSLEKLIVGHARNQWSYPTDEWIAHYSEAIRNAQAQAVVACDNQKLVGAAIFETGSQYIKYQTSSEQKQHGYIAEVVVDGAHAKRGIGTELFCTAIHELILNGMDVIYTKRHEENLPSARLMEKCGFIVVDTFDDPERTSGSRRTSICKLSVQNFKL